MPMLPQLTDAMKAVLQQAQADARHLNQEFVSIEHLLLALLHTEHTDVMRVLKSLRLDPELLRSEVAEFLPFSETPPSVSGDLPLSPKAQRLINSAVVKSRALREPKVSTRLLMLSIIDEGNSLLNEALRSAGTTTADLQVALGSKPEHPEA
ncbi:MAG TPA: Clp protease N-terminal domain-containing protein [Tepidisphaeraceae bacterium]|nr:Clp protease N-terminal domain-containing protein [Tepidisphaeraceae bacterium]